MFRSRLPRIRSSLRDLEIPIATPRRTFHASVALQHLHQVPLLHYAAVAAVQGIPEFLSPVAFDMAWNQYQSLMVGKLNATISSDSPWATKQPKDIAIGIARDPSMASIFNFASMAHNNHFFFNGLAMEETPMPAELKKQLEISFSSIETLKETMLLQASQMFGPGFVWLVMYGPGATGASHSGKKFGLLNTYLAGSPYSGAHFRKQAVDMNTQADPVTYPLDILDSLPVVNGAGAHGRHSEKQKKKAPGGLDVTPVLCINTWEHVWLPDYGIEGATDYATGAVYQGKREFAERWWRRINWRTVANYGNIGKVQRGNYE